jgi:hypothetical protein
MLEASSLLIHPWQRTGEGPGDERPGGWSRTVQDGATSAALGAVRWQGPPRRGWLDWLRGQRLEVLETEDAALLMTLVRPWGLSRQWDVYDAEERRVGTVHPPALLDSDGGRRGYLDRHSETRGKIVETGSRPLADYERRSDEVTLLQFAPDLEANPFLRMLVLACVVVQEPAPGRTRRRRHARE